MTPDIFVKYLEQPTLLVSMPYQELKTLVVQYPYAQNLRLMLLLKSILDKHKDKDRNLQLAATYCTDRDALYAILQKIEDSAMTPLQAASFLMEEDVLVLKSLAEVDYLLKKTPESAPTFPEKNELKALPLTEQSNVIEFEDVNEIEQTDNQASLQDNSNIVEFELQEEDAQESYEAFGDEFPTKANAASDSLEAAVPTAPPQPKANALPTYEEEIPFEIYVADHKVPDTMEKIAVDLNVDDIFDEIALFNQKPLAEAPSNTIQPSPQTARIVLEEKELPISIPPKVVVLPILGISTPQKVILQPESPKILPIVRYEEKASFYQEISHQPVEDTDNSSVNDFLMLLLESQEATYITPTPYLENTRAFPEKDAFIEEENQEEVFASETLAALLVKQGAKEKAIKMYQKLSLTFPEKSTYFAAQIADLRKKT